MWCTETSVPHVTSATWGMIFLQSGQTLSFDRFCRQITRPEFPATMQNPPFTTTADTTQICSVQGCSGVIPRSRGMKAKTRRKSLQRRRVTDLWKTESLPAMGAHLSSNSALQTGENNQCDKSPPCHSAAKLRRPQLNLERAKDVQELPAFLSSCRNFPACQHPCDLSSCQDHN